MPRLYRDSMTWLMYVQLGIWGYFLYGFGPVVPLLRDEQHISRTVASLHSTALAAGGALGGATFPYLRRRFGRGATMWLGLFGVCLGVAAMCTLRPVPATLTSVLVISGFGTLTLAGVNAALDERHGAAGTAAIAEANALACGVGAFAPLTVGASMAAGWTWRPALAAVIGLIGLTALGARVLRIRLPDGPATGTEPPAIGHPAPLADLVPTAGSDEPAVPESGARRAPADRLPVGFWLAWSLIACTGSVEVCLSLWAGDLLRNHAGVSVDGAAAAISGIVAGMCLGRVVGSRVALRVPAPRLLGSVLVVSLAGFVLFWIATVPTLAVTGLIICGIGNGMHYPLGIGMALRASAGRPDLASARTAYASSIAFGATPVALAALADRIGTRIALLLIPVFLAGAALLLVPLGRRLAAGRGVGDRPGQSVTSSERS